ncbi:hypothetical protein ACSSS7_000773 [Eimeria intestinalis]
MSQTLKTHQGHLPAGGGWPLQQDNGPLTACLRDAILQILRGPPTSQGAAGGAPSEGAPVDMLPETKDEISQCQRHREAPGFDEAQEVEAAEAAGISATAATEEWLFSKLHEIEAERDKTRQRLRQQEIATRDAQQKYIEHRDRASTLARRVVHDLKERRLMTNQLAEVEEKLLEERETRKRLEADKKNLASLCLRPLLLLLLLLLLQSAAAVVCKIRQRVYVPLLLLLLSSLVPVLLLQGATAAAAVIAAATAAAGAVLTASNAAAPRGRLDSPALMSSFRAGDLQRNLTEELAEVSSCAQRLHAKIVLAAVTAAAADVSLLLLLTLISFPLMPLFLLLLLPVLPPMRTAAAAAGAAAWAADWENKYEESQAQVSKVLLLLSLLVLLLLLLLLLLLHREQMDQLQIFASDLAAEKEETHTQLRKQMQLNEQLQAELTEVTEQLLLQEQKRRQQQQKWRQEHLSAVDR